jgi:DNA-binding GntR family transcriptional regulator
MTESLADRAYEQLRAGIVRLDFEPGSVLREDDLCHRLGIGRTPVREALQRLARDQFIQVIPRKGMFVTGIDVAELPLLFETRSVLEPFAARLAAARGSAAHWDAMARVIEGGPEIDAEVFAASGATHGQALTEADRLLARDRRCHQLIWKAADNRFLVDTLDVLYAQSDRLWHLYLADVADMPTALAEHGEILAALRAGDEAGTAALVEAHVRSFHAQVRNAITARLDAPLAG